MKIPPDTLLGSYQIERFLGHGGMGEVYSARDTRIGRSVAIKIVVDRLAASEEHKARLKREAQLLACVNHPNVAVLYEFETSEMFDYVVMELVEGETLADRIGKGPIPTSDALALLFQVACGLEAAHNKGVVHRDLKPANVNLARDGVVKILDFGLSKQMSKPEPGNTGIPMPPTLSVDLTQEGQILGTPSYMSPEQVRGQDVDKQSDIWAFGCLFYETLSGTRAFSGNSSSEILAAVLTKEPDWQRLPEDTPEVIRRLIRRCLCKDVRERLHDIGDARLEMAETITRNKTGCDTTTATAPTCSQKRPQRRVLAIAAIVAVLASALMFGWWSPTVPPSPPRHKPVVLLMDSAFPAHVYDEETRKPGLTNTHDLTAILRDLPITTHMELISPEWKREREVIEEEPTLIIIHRSGFSSQVEPVDWDNLDKESADKIFNEHYKPAWERLVVFLGTAAASTQRTKFLVYSRRWGVDRHEKWIKDTVSRFPALAGRLFVFSVPVDEHGEGSFRDPETAESIRQVVSQLLSQDSSEKSDSEK